MSYTEGQKAYNKETGQTAVFTNGEWRVVPNYSKTFEQSAPEWTKPITSAMQGLTFNNFDELVGAVAKVHGESYEKARDRVRQAGSEFAKENPKTDITLNVLGSLPTLWLPGGQAKTGASVLQKSMAVMAPAVGYGGLSAAGASEGTTPTQVAGDVLSGGLQSGAIAGGLGITGKIAGGIGRNILERVPAAEGLRQSAAQQRLAQLLTRDVEAKMPGMPANPYQAARARLTALGGRSPIAATGRNVASELDLLASMPGSAETLAEREARRISTGRGPTLQAAAAGALKEGQGLPGYVTDMIEQRRTASEPLYKQVNTLTVPVDKELESLLKRSESAHGLAEVTAKIAGKPIDLSKLRAEDTKVVETTDALMNTIRQTITTPGSQVPFEALDKVKQSLYDAATAAKKGGHTNLGNEYDRLRKQLTEKLDRLSPKDAQGVSIYKTARETFAGPSQLLDAAESGANALTMKASDLREAVAQMTAGELEAFKVGAAQAFKEKLGSQSGQTQLMAFAKNPNIEERIDLVFGKDARQFKKSLLQEAELKKLERAGQGSQTFKRMAAAEDQAKAMEVMQDVGQAATAPSTLVSKIPQWYGQLAMPEQTRNQLAKMLLMRGPQAQQELNILEEYMRKRAGREKASRMATALAGREIAE